MDSHLGSNIFLPSLCRSSSPPRAIYFFHTALFSPAAQNDDDKDKSLCVSGHPHSLIRSLYFELKMTGIGIVCIYLLCSFSIISILHYFRDPVAICSYLPVLLFSFKHHMNQVRTLMYFLTRFDKSFSLLISFSILTSKTAGWEANHRQA